MHKNLDRYVLFYPLRLVGSTFLIVATALYIRRFSDFNAYHFVFYFVLLLHPHIVRLLGSKYDHRRAGVELAAFGVDAFYLGLGIHLTSFSLLPTLVFATVALANALAVNGFRQMLFSGFALATGTTLPMLFAGINFAPKDDFALNLACSIFLFIYFNTFAFSAFNRSMLLKHSQRELREQKATLEIQKMRSDQLLLHLVPAELAERLEKEGNLATEVYDPATLVTVDFEGFTRALEEREAGEVLEFLTTSFKAFDAITARHGLEKLKTMGDRYLAVAGLPTSDPNNAANAIRAALEIREYLAETATSRQAHDNWVLKVRIAVHSGKVLGGLMQTARLSYDIWGETVSTLFRLERQAPLNQVLVSAPTRDLAGDDFRWSAAGKLAHEDIGEIAVFNVERGNS